MGCLIPPTYFGQTLFCDLLANIRAVRVKYRISLRNGMWHGMTCGNSIIMLNVIYAEWFKELNSTEKRARLFWAQPVREWRQIIPPACRRPFLVSISTFSTLFHSIFIISPRSPVNEKASTTSVVGLLGRAIVTLRTTSNEGWRKCQSKGVTDCRFNVGNVTIVWNVVSVFRNLSFNWG